MTHSPQVSEPQSLAQKADTDSMKLHCANLISSMRAKHSLLAKPSGRGATILQCSLKGTTIRVTLACITTSDFVGTLQLNTYVPFLTLPTVASWEYSTSISAMDYASLWLQLMAMAEHVLPELVS